MKEARVANHLEVYAVVMLRREVFAAEYVYRPDKRKEVEAAPRSLDGVGKVGFRQNAIEGPISRRSSARLQWVPRWIAKVCALQPGKEDGWPGHRTEWQQTPARSLEKSPSIAALSTRTSLTSDTFRPRRIRRNVIGVRPS